MRILKNSNKMLPHLVSYALDEATIGINVTKNEITNSLDETTQHFLR